MKRNICTLTDSSVMAHERMRSSHQRRSKTEGWLRQLSGVTVWTPATTKGRRTFDDTEFYTSLSRQFAVKKSLSPRQKGALKAMVRRYSKTAGVADE